MLGRAALVVGVVLAGLGGGCAGDDSASSDTDLLTISVRSSAADAGREAGVDVEELVRSAAEEALERIDLERPTLIEVRVDPASTIPEVGVGGFTNERHRIALWVERPLRDGSETWIRALVAHELHHAARMQTGPGYGYGLGGALVSEGLADHFAEEVFPATPRQPWNHALTQAQESNLWRQARQSLSGPYDHGEWFFGMGDLPRFAGYTLGYRIVGAYLGEDRRASDAVDVEAANVLSAYRRR